MARYEIDSALEYVEWELFAPMAARRLWYKIEKTKKCLSMNPYMYPIVKKKSLAQKDFRYVTIGNYLMFYKVAEQEKVVYVHKFLYGRRDWQNML